VFIHGLLVNGSLWNGVADLLAADGFRCYQPDLPLGSHKLPLNADAYHTPQGVATIIDAFLGALDLDDVTLVGNDTGGALCQFTIDAHPERIGRLLLTNCDAFDKFPPPPFGSLISVAQRPAVAKRVMAPMRSTKMRHSALGFGLLAHSFDAEMTLDWILPALEQPEIREDLARFARGINPDDLLAVSTRLGAFTKPVKLVWGEDDRFFKPEFGRRLAEAFGHATYVGIPGARLFVALDAPDRLADELKAFSRGEAQAATPVAAAPRTGTAA
jgi:pimeloyl-ACP methyl ester carboxylesterase